MPNETDTYRTILEPTEEVLLREKKSKFYGIAYPLSHGDEVKSLIDALKKQHHGANHVCYAWQLGVTPVTYRTHDDGEPNNSAGMPIYGQIQSFKVTNILVAVTRYFGGTKLGVGGLISAYREAAQMALQTGNIVERILQRKIALQFEYPQMDVVMRTIKQQGLTIVSQNMAMDCQLIISVPESSSAMFLKTFGAMHGIKSQIVG